MHQVHVETREFIKAAIHVPAEIAIKRLNLIKYNTLRANSADQEDVKSDMYDCLESWAVVRRAEIRATHIGKVRLRHPELL